MTPIENKILQFIAEAGDKNQYTPEQQKIYYSFTSKNAIVYINVTDSEGVTLKIKFDSNTEVKHILLKHYQEQEGNVTAGEILNMLDIIKTGAKHYNKGNYAYIKRYVKRGTVFYTVIKLFANGKDAVLKSFHSNRGYK